MRSKGISDFYFHNRMFLAKFAILFPLVVSAIFLSMLPSSKEYIEEEVLEAGSCDISKTNCSFSIPVVGGGRVELSPLPLESGKRFSVIVKNLDFHPEKLEIDLLDEQKEMIGNRRELRKAENGHIVETVLPVCLSERMIWRLTLLVYVGGKRFSIPWKFEVIGGMGAF